MFYVITKENLQKIYKTQEKAIKAYHCQNFIKSPWKTEREKERNKETTKQKTVKQLAVLNVYPSIFSIKGQRIPDWIKKKKKKKQDPIYMFLRDSLALRTHINREVAKNIPCIKGKKKAGIPILISDKSD